MTDPRTAEEWFTDALQEGENDPDFLTAGLVLDLSERLYVRMKELGLRPSDLAERLGMSRASVSQLLGGKPNVTIRTLVGAAHALGLHVHVELRERPIIDNTAEGTHSPTAVSSER